MSTCRTSISLLRIAVCNQIKCSKRATDTNQNWLAGSRIISAHFHTDESLAKQVSFKLSDIGEGIREVVVKEWFIKVGDKVKQFDNICEVQSDKASATITSRYDGTIQKLHYKIEDVATVGQPLVDINTEDDSESPEEDTVSSTNATPEPTSNSIRTDKSEKSKSPECTSSEDEKHPSKETLCLPSVRRLAKQNDIDLGKVVGSGKNGRISREDLFKYLDDQKQKSQKDPTSDDVFIDKIEPVTGFQKAMVKSMTSSLKMPLFNYGEEVSVKKLTELRKTLKTMPELSDIPISYMPFFIKAMSNALVNYPIINSHYDEEKESIIYKKPHNIGIAMDTEVGLAIPVIKKVENLTIVEIAKELKRLIECGKRGSFSIEDMSQVSILISNIGSIGGTYVKPIPLNLTSTIVGIGAIQKLPRFDSSMNIIADEIIAVSSSGDHRIIDGATMARFVKIFKHHIENPHLLLLKL